MARKHRKEPNLETLTKEMKEYGFQNFKEVLNHVADGVAICRNIQPYRKEVFEYGKNN